MTTTPAAYELRAFAEPIEFRSAQNGTQLVAAGVAMKYGARSRPFVLRSRGVVREEFRSGAFTKTLQESDVRAHLEHLGPYLSRVSNGTLRLMDSRSELAYEIDLPQTTAGRDAAAMLERDDVRGCSIGFRAMPGADDWSVDGDGLALRSVGEARLFRVDLTTDPVYNDSTAEMALRSFAEARSLPLEDVLTAAAAGEFRSLLEAPDPGDPNSDPDPQGDGRAATVTRPRIQSLYL